MSRFIRKFAVGLTAFGLATGVPAAVEAQEDDRGAEDAETGNTSEAIEADSSETAVNSEVSEIRMSLKDALMGLLKKMRESMNINSGGSHIYYELNNNDLLLIGALETCFLEGNIQVIEEFLKDNPDYLVNPNFYMVAADLDDEAKNERWSFFYERTKEFPDDDEYATPYSGLADQVALALFPRIDFDQPFNMSGRGGMYFSNGSLFHDLVALKLPLNELADKIEERDEMLTTFDMFHSFQEIGIELEGSPEEIDFKRRIIPFLDWKYLSSDSYDLDYIAFSIIELRPANLPRSTSFPTEELQLLAFREYLKVKGKRGLKFESAEHRDGALDGMQNAELGALVLSFPVKGECPAERRKRVKALRRASREE
jgi:hypothetical protein